MTRTSRTLRRGTLLSLAIATAALFVGAATASAMPRQIDDPTGQFGGSYIYYDLDPTGQTGTIGICIKAGPNQGWFFGTNTTSPPSGNIAPPAPQPIANCLTGTPVIADTYPDDNKTPDTIFDPTGILLSNGSDLGWIHFYFDPDAQQGEISVCAKNPSGPMTGYFRLAGPTEQSAPVPPAAECPSLLGGGGGGSVDTDLDGVDDTTDNCLTVANPNQADFDGDHVGDVCDDSDNDGVMDAVDGCRTQAGPASNNGCPAAAPTTSGGEKAPNTKAQGPKSTTNPRPTFKLNSNTPGAKFECRIDKKGKYKPCKKHFKPSKALKPGKHTLEVRAVANGKRDSSPAKLKFTVKRKK